MLGVQAPGTRLVGYAAPGQAFRRADVGGCLPRKHPRNHLGRRRGMTSSPLEQGHLYAHETLQFVAHASTKESESSDDKLSINPEILGSIGLVVFFGITNRILYKMALNPLSDYVFFLAQFQTFSYVLVYFGILAYKRYVSGQVKKEDLEVTDKKTFFWIGAAEAASQLLGFIGASKLPGVVLPLFSQTILLWQILVGKLVLKRTFSPTQITGALVVIAGVCTAAFPTKGASVFQDVEYIFVVVYIISMLFPAISAVFKEKIFSDAKEKLGGRTLDLFAVNSFGSAAQALFVLLLLPVLSSLRGIPLGELPNYLREGGSCLIGSRSGCGSAPGLASLYVGCNLAFNISLLNLLRASNSVIQSLTLSAIVPLTIFAFTFPLPYLDDPPSIGLNFAIGTLILFGGLLTYNSEKFLPALKKKLGKSD